MRRKERGRRDEENDWRRREEGGGRKETSKEGRKNTLRGKNREEGRKILTIKGEGEEQKEEGKIMER